MVENYNVAVNEVSRAFELLGAAHTRMKSCFGDYFHIIDDEIRSYRIGDSKRNIESSKSVMKRDAWRHITSKMNIESFMTEKRKNQLFEQLKSDDLPELTVENIADFFKSFSSNINTLMEESANEAFEILRPHQSKHKTNTEYEIGKKAIITCCFTYGCSISSYYDYKITLIDNVFHLLDGKGVAKYPDDLKSLIYSASNKHMTHLETEYFKLKWYYGANTMHFEFLRKDLLDKLNAMCGGNRLKT
jgi:hypothetical protein